MRATGCVWLIDAAYVLQCHVGTINYAEIRAELEAWVGSGFDEVIFYNSTINDGKADGFHEYLREKCGFVVKLFPLKRSTYTCEHCGHHGSKQVQRGVDVAICTDLLSLAYEGRFKRVVLTAGDGDLLSAIQLVKRRFQKVYLNGYRKSMSADLMAEANGVYWM